MIQPPFLSTIGAKPRHVTFLTIETAVGKKPEKNDGQMGSPCLDKPVLAQGGGGSLACISSINDLDPEFEIENRSVKNCAHLWPSFS